MEENGPGRRTSKCSSPELEQGWRKRGGGARGSSRRKPETQKIRAYVEFPIFRKIFVTSILVVDLKLTSLADWTQVLSVPVLRFSSKLIPFAYLGAQ